jgi:ketosteroid isomerase-like protein
MGAKENVVLVERYLAAGRDQNWDVVRDCLAEDVTFRMAGVPRTMGGVTEGRDAVMSTMQRGGIGGTTEARKVFGDDANVCVVAKVTASRFPGNDHLRAAEAPYSTYECIVYELRDGKIAGSSAYVNWLDPYVQVGLVDPAGLQG